MFYVCVLVQNFGAKNYKAETYLKKIAQFAFVQKIHDEMMKLTPGLGGLVNRECIIRLNKFHYWYVGSLIFGFNHFC